MISPFWDSPQRTVEDGKIASNSVWFPGDKRHDWERPCFHGYKTVVLGDSQLKVYGRNKKNVSGYNIASFSGCDVSRLLESRKRILFRYSSLCTFCGVELSKTNSQMRILSSQSQIATSSKTERIKKICTRILTVRVANRTVWENSMEDWSSE